MRVQVTLCPPARKKMTYLRHPSILRGHQKNPADGFKAGHYRLLAGNLYRKALFERLELPLLTDTTFGLYSLVPRCPSPTAVAGETPHKTLVGLEKTNCATPLLMDTQ